MKRVLRARLLGAVAGFYSTTRSIYMSKAKFRVGLTLLIALLLLGFVISVFTPTDTRTWFAVPKDLPPSFEHPLGTSTMGRDVFWELCASIKNSITLALMTALIASHIGLLLGLVAGIRGGIVDRMLMFITDTFIIIPGLPLLMVVVTVLKQWITIPLLGALISIVSWPWPARQVRAMVLSLRERAFVYTAMLSGMGTLKVLLREIMPFLLGWHLINFTNTILFAIGMETGLAILGLSVLGENTLGVMIYWALNQFYALFRGILWWIASPIATLTLIFVSFYLTSVGLSEHFHPRLK